MSKEREPIAWITRGGKHIPIYADEPSDDEKKKNMQIQQSKEQAKERTEKKSLMDKYTDKDSYIHDPEFKSLEAKASKAGKDKEELTKKWLDMGKELEKETVIDKETLDMFDGDRTLAKMFAKKTPKGEKLEKERDEVYKQMKKAEEDWEHYSGKRNKRIKDESEKQKEAYVKSTSTVSDKVKDDYKGFKTADTGVPYTNELLAKGKAFVVEMSPKQYLQECAYKIFDSTYEQQILVGQADNEGVTQKLVGLMQNGTKMYTPYLNYRDKQQEGRHRAIAAMEMGIDRIPVVIVRK